MHNRFIYTNPQDKKLREAEVAADAKERRREYREENKEKLGEYQKNYYQDNKEYFKEYNKNYYQDNKEYFKEYIKNYNEVNKEEVVEKRKIYYQDNKEKILQNQKNYYQRNKDTLLGNMKESYKNKRAKILQERAETKELVQLAKDIEEDFFGVVEQPKKKDDSSFDAAMLFINKNKPKKQPSPPLIQNNHQINHQPAPVENDNQIINNYQLPPQVEPIAIPLSQTQLTIPLQPAASAPLAKPIAKPAVTQPFYSIPLKPSSSPWSSVPLVTQPAVKPANGLLFSTSSPMQIPLSTNNNQAYDQANNKKRKLESINSYK